jgi:alpha-1,6-mannosyltransferase
MNRAPTPNRGERRTEAPESPAPAATEPPSPKARSRSRSGLVVGITLTAIGLASLTAYIGFFAFPFPLERYAAVPLQDLGKLTRYGMEAALAYAAAVLLLFALYYAGYLVVRRWPAAALPEILLVFPVAFAVALAQVYPILAADIFGYIAHARVWTVHGANPFLTPAAAFPADPFLPLTAWPDEPSTYGPAWLLLSAPVALFGGDDLLRNLLGFKALVLVFLALDVWLVHAILRHWRPAVAPLGVYLLAWNPLVQLDVAANGHNDVVMAFFVLLAVWALVRGWVGLVLPALTLGALIKFTPAVLLPLAAVYLVRRAGRSGRRWALLAGSVLASGALAVLFYAPFWAGPASVGFLRRGDLFTASLGNLLRLLAQPALGNNAASLARLVGYGAFAVAMLLLVPRAWRGREGAVSAFYIAIFAFILFATLWFQSWYVLWLLPLAALLPARGLQDRAILLSFGALASYEVFIFVWVMNWYSLDELRVQLLATTTIYGPFLVYSAARLLRRRTTDDGRRTSGHAT